MGDGPGGWRAAVDELEGNGLNVLEWLELMLNEDGGVNETVRSSRIDKSVDGDRRLAWNQKMDQEGEMAR